MTVVEGLFGLCLQFLSMPMIQIVGWERRDASVLGASFKNTSSKCHEDVSDSTKTTILINST